MKYKEIYDEYNFLLAKLNDYAKILLTLKDGYISTKTISGKKYYYLQKKINNKINSEYIRAELLPQIEAQLQKRGEAETEIKLINEQLGKLETAVMVVDKNLYRTLINLKRSSAMDFIPLDIRKKSLEFGNAMTALEGIPASEETDKNLLLWAAGEHSFKDSYLQTLAKYNLMESNV